MRAPVQERGGGGQDGEASLYTILFKTQAATAGTVVSLLTSEAKMDAKGKKNLWENGVLYH